MNHKDLIKTKPLLTAIFFLSFMINMCSYTLAAESDENTPQDYLYVIQDDKAVIKRCFLTDEYIEIPEEIDGYRVVELDDLAFFANTTVKKVKLPNTVKKIGERVFCQTPLEEIELPDSLESIGDWTFRETNLKTLKIPRGVKTIPENMCMGCRQLTSVEIPDTVEKIEYYAFCVTGLESVTLPESVTSVGQGAFSYNSNLTSFTFPKSLTYVPAEIFSGCSRLSEVKLHNEITSVGSWAFEECTALEHIDLPDSVTEIESQAFLNSGLKNIEMPKNLKTIGDFAFYRCTGLETVTFNEGLECIEYGAFESCSSLKNVVLPSSLNKLGPTEYAYLLANSRTVRNVDRSNPFPPLESISVSPDNSTFLSEDNVVYTKDKSTILICAQSKSGDFTAASTVKTIGNSAFASCNKLNNVSLPYGLEEIADDAFIGCYNLKLDIPETVTKIGDGAFAHCRSLERAFIPEGVTELDASTFYCCTSLKEVSLPDSLKKIESYAFENTALEKLVIPKNVTEIGSSVFEGCTSLSDITIGRSVKKIGYEAFYGVPAKSIRFKGDLPELSGGALYGLSLDCVFYYTAGKRGWSDKLEVFDCIAVEPDPNDPDDTWRSYLFGDVNGDDKIAADDSAAILQKTLNNAYTMPIENLYDDYMEITDVNCDNAISAADSAMVLQKVLNSAYKMPIENN